MTMPGKPVFGAGVLRYPAMQSPNYVAGASGWIIRQDGSVEFNNGTFRGTITAGTFQGNNFIINSAGQFFYSPTPGANNLVASIVPGSVGVNDPYGNVAFPGVTTYAFAGGGLYFALQQTNALAFNLWCTSNMTIGWTGASGVLSLSPQTSGGASPTFTRLTMTLTGQVLSTGGTAANPTLITTDTWHSLGALSGASGYTVNEGRYMLTTDGMTEIDVQLVATAAAAAGTYAFANALPAGPTVQRSYPLGYNGAQTTGTSWPSLRVGGSVQVQIPALPTGTVLSCTQRVPLNLAGVAGLAPGMRPPVAPSFGADHHQAFLAYGLHGVMPGVPQVTGCPGGVAVARAVPAVLHWRDRVLSIRKGCWHWRSPLREIAAGAPQPRPRMPSILARCVCARKCAHVRACAERRAGHRGTVRSMIDRDSPAPAWEQLAGILRERIHTGQITVRLPGERALQQEFGLAPATIRRAVRALQSEGLVTTVTGRGTFVVRSEGGAAAERGQ